MGGEESEAAWRAGRDAWPGVEVPGEAYAAHLKDRGGKHESDLYLACGCVLGLPAALAAFDKTFILRLRKYVRTLKLSATQLEDLQQILREKLLVAPSRLADYSGRGTLEGWFRVLALREGLDLITHHEERRPIASRPPDRAAPGDLAEDALKARYRPQFNAALREAISTLGAEQRNLLRLHYLEGLTLDELAAFFGVHRATIARRVAEAREAVSDGMTERLKAALDLSAAELDSLLVLLRSQLEVSISACFAETAA